MTPETLGPYQLGEPLGKGGMGTVYRGRHTEDGDEVAIKVLDPRLAVAEGFRDRFESEIESLKALRHAGIVRLLGYGEEEGVLFYAMELIDGPSLEEELRAGRRFDWREVTQIAIQVCRALKHAHDHGVIHRDLKPANILLAGDGRTKLADFGIARVFGSTGVTIAGGVLGTADYMSPEQAAGKPVTARCDQYSLAGVIYALLSGRPPFRATDLAAMLQLQRFAIPEPVRRFAPDTPAELERIIAKMLEKDPPDRFPNTQVVARRLEAMNQALARVAADDFEVYQTGQAKPDPESDDEGDDTDLAFAETRDAATELMAEPLAGRAPASDPEAAPRTLGTTFVEVEKDAPSDAGSSWAAIGGQALVLALAIGTLGGIAWWLGRPASADTLYDQIGRSLQTGESTGPALDAVDEFTRRFPDDNRIDQVDEWGRTLRLEQIRRKLQLARLGRRAAEDKSPEELLLQRAARLAADDPDAGAAAFDGLAKLLLAGSPDSSDSSLADVASSEAIRLRQEATAERQALAAFCLERLQALGDDEDATPVAAAVRALLAESPETEAALKAADAMLAEGVADEDPVR